MWIKTMSGSNGILMPAILDAAGFKEYRILTSDEMQADFQTDDNIHILVGVVEKDVVKPRKNAKKKQVFEDLSFVIIGVYKDKERALEALGVIYACLDANANACDISNIQVVLEPKQEKDNDE